jgi:hypothetical protein
LESLTLISSFSPTLYYLNASSIPKPDAIEQLMADLHWSTLSSSITTYKSSDLLILDNVEAAVLQIQQDYLKLHFILAGDLNSLSDVEVVIRTGLTSTVNQPTRENSKLDRLYVSDLQFDGIKVVKSTVKSDHVGIVTYRGGLEKKAGKTRRTFMFRIHLPKQHALFLRSMEAGPNNFQI